MPTTSKKSTTEKFVKYHKDGTLWAKGQMLGEELHGF